PAALGSQGQLVLSIGRASGICRIPLDRVKVGETVPLEGTGLKFTLKKIGQLFEMLEQQPEEARENMPSYPAVKFELTKDGKSGTYISCARLPRLRALR